MTEDEREEHEDEDKTIVEALSSMGWVEEKEEMEEITDSEGDIEEQLNFFRDENKRLIGEITQKNENINSKNEIINNLKIKVEELSRQLVEKVAGDQEAQKLTETIESKNDEIEQLNNRFEEESHKLQKIIEEQNQKIIELTSQMEEVQSNQTDLVSDKDNQIKQLQEQLHYLESDTIQKSKFEKVEVLVEKKDEIITEKEKTIFTLENSLKAANQRIQEIQQQQETFNLLKKDLEKKTERNKELVVQLEELNQKNITNSELINRLEEKLEDAHKKSGNITGKFEMELANLRNLLDGKDNEIKTLKENYQNIDSELHEYKKIEEKILGDIQNIKDEKLKLESEIDLKNNEIVDLKKKIKLMRRDLQKS